ncbi:hypothetical protein C8A01DRAFT_33551 [Parachaetomium inaequale]|uniref:Uncharacterized protein n=1 Tax=Parachaetomium inaequale TaxID=2588326 RepID=A0AAN6PLP7_9PEZI|nr:hypothetical protein C8A01DRAFT_33551 [Parachaetomium inaequale]
MAVGGVAQNTKTGDSALARLLRNRLPSPAPKSTASLPRSSPSPSSASLDSCASSPADMSAAALEKFENPNTETFSVWEAEAAIRAFVDEHWPHRADYIKIDCRVTLPALHALGRLPRADGARACGRLIRVPFIHEEVALSLWEHLAEEARTVPTPTPCATADDTARLGEETKTTRPQRRTFKSFVKSLLPTTTTTTTQPVPVPITPPPRCPFCSGNCIPSSTSHHHHHPQHSNSSSTTSTSTTWLHKLPTDTDPFWQPNPSSRDPHPHPDRDLADTDPDTDTDPVDPRKLSGETLVPLLYTPGESSVVNPLVQVPYRGPADGILLSESESEAGTEVGGGRGKSWAGVLGRGVTGRGRCLLDRVKRAVVTRGRKEVGEGEWEERKVVWLGCRGEYAVACG